MAKLIILIIYNTFVILPLTIILPIIAIVNKRIKEGLEVRKNWEQRLRETLSPFTGSEKIVDATGRVEKFKKKYNLK